MVPAFFVLLFVLTVSGPGSDPSYDRVAHTRSMDRGTLVGRGMQQSMVHLASFPSPCG